MPETAFSKQLHPSHLDIAKLVVIGASQAATIIASVLVLRRLVDQLNSGAPKDALPLTYIFVGVGILLAITRYIEYLVAERVGYRLVAKLRMVLFSHLLAMPSRNVRRSSQGALLLRFTGDLSTFRTWISRGLSRGIVSVCTVLGALGVLVVIDWLIALAVLGVLLLGSAASALQGYQVKRSTRAIRWRRSLLTSNVAEQISSVAVVQAFGRASGESARLGVQNQDLLRSLYRAASARGWLRFIASASGSIAVGTVLAVGVLQMTRNQVSLGGVVAAMTAARFLTGPVRTLGRSHEYWQAAQVSKTKLRDFFERPERSGTSENLPPLRPRRGRLEFEGISVDGSLDDINLVIEPGELVAIVGSNGAGKSTLLSVVSRSVEPSQGRILIDDQVLSECSLRSTARNIGIVSPDLPLMRGTLLRNITYRYGTASDDMVQQVMLSCQIDEILESSSEREAAWLVEGGTNLSMGHRQRVMLARATLGNPRLLLLDEPTTNLDVATKKVFHTVISRYRGTVLLATNDPEEASLADHVCVMNSGRIVDYLTGEQYRSGVEEQLRVGAGRPRW